MTAHSDIARKVNSMALTLDIPEIAAKCGLPEADVISMVRRNSHASRWVGECLRTGRQVSAFTERGAYLRAQIAGFCDWTLYGVPKMGEPK